MSNICVASEIAKVVFLGPVKGLLPGVGGVSGLVVQKNEAIGRVVNAGTPAISWTRNEACMRYSQYSLISFYGLSVVVCRPGQYLQKDDRNWHQRRAVGEKTHEPYSLEDGTHAHAIVIAGMKAEAS
ncbi:uncharacterized protein VDAG_00615 [Verticillium dahliae VdLs.17]|uniref:Uncharacterized protein n=1 Tax=Verticillium dahliae (strain VdLs.17 / ATCC MYA-4575 / FGSC 10137) TaxID=498257 RepID=G2WQH3_VERDV|nr:uncharacterized protein VDAG_00615 [Verticillium dahliae VdLs.17]EGY13933.1 hypothetical protein VDAG_00615 [Verticillium dahliae VdLs.17]